MSVETVFAALKIS
jgi:hypothetical protein